MSDRGANSRALLERVKQDISRCQSTLARYRAAEFWLLIGSTVCGGLATAVAAGMAAAGDNTANQVGGWRIVCLFVAALTAIAAVCGAIHKSLRISERLADTLVCMAELKSLELDLETGAKDAKDAGAVFKVIVQKHPAVLA